jgi:hypothetical protein
VKRRRNMWRSSGRFSREGRSSKHHVDVL